MNRLLAMMFSLLLLGQQTMLGASPEPFSPEVCRCCDCGKTWCCVSESAPEPDSQPAAPLPPRTNLSETVLSPATSVAWLLPTGESSPADSDPSVRLPARDQPLYQRDCALLI